MGLQSRDFVDKYCIFAIENKVYVLFSAMPNNLEEHPLPAKTARARTVVGMSRIERCRDSGKIRCIFLNQADLNIKMGTSVLQKFVGPQTSDWVKKWSKYLLDQVE